MMPSKRPQRATPGELAYIRDLEKNSAFELVDGDAARILSVAEYPEPLKRFIKRERNMVHVSLSPRLRMKVEARSRQTGMPISKLARLWIEAGINDEAKRSRGGKSRRPKRRTVAVHA